MSERREIDVTGDWADKRIIEALQEMRDAEKYPPKDTFPFLKLGKIELSAEHDLNTTVDAAEQRQIILQETAAQAGLAALRYAPPFSPPASEFFETPIGNLQGAQIAFLLKKINDHAIDYMFEKLRRLSDSLTDPAEKHAELKSSFDDIYGVAVDNLQNARLFLDDNRRQLLVHVTSQLGIDNDDLRETIMTAGKFASPWDLSRFNNKLQRAQKSGRMPGGYLSTENDQSE